MVRSMSTLSRARSHRSSGSATPECGKLLRRSALTNALAARIDTELQQRGRYGVILLTKVFQFASAGGKLTLPWIHSLAIQTSLPTADAAP